MSLSLQVRSRTRRRGIGYMTVAYLALLCTDAGMQQPRAQQQTGQVEGAIGTRANVQAANERESGDRNRSRAADRAAALRLEERVHVRFDETMLVAVNQKAAVAVVFEPPDDPTLFTKTLKYRWRSNQETMSGEGTIPANGTNQVLNIPHVRLLVKLTPNRGNVVYDPEASGVHPVDRTFYEVFELGSPEKPNPRPVNLSHFLIPNQEIQDQFRKRRYSGQATEPGYPRRPLSFKVRYRENGLVVANPDGVAVFEFGEPMTRTSGDESRRGVKYRWRFVSANADKTGDGEVWELYRNDQYVYQETLHYVEAGQIHIPWSINSTDAGWIYYDPAWHAVWLVSPQTASQLAMPGSPSAALQRFKFGSDR